MPGGGGVAVRSCCQEYEEILKALASVRQESLPSTHERLDRIKKFIEWEKERHEDDAVENL